MTCDPAWKDASRVLLAIELVAIDLYLLACVGAAFDAYLYMR